jgi:hypothetical protein
VTKQRIPLEKSGYVLAKKPYHGVALLRDPSGRLEVWYANDYHDGLTIEIGGFGYERSTRDGVPALQA